MSTPDVSSPAAWEERYQTADTPWDLPLPAPALAAWLTTHPGQGRRAFIPGCGRGQDAVALAEAGYAVTALDFSASACAATRALAAARGVTLEVLQADLFSPELPLGFDLWVEHTCFCAIDPAMRPAYVETAVRLLKPGAHLYAIFYAHGKPGGPPFDVQRPELEALFSPAFELLSLAPASHSIDRRAGQELEGLLVRR